MFNDISEKRHCSKMIMDSIHGAISLFEHEMAVIDHPLFQRLRFIIQNDVLHFTFMGSTHTRFSHSIGAAHVASKMFKQIILNKIIYHEKSNPDFRLSEIQADAVEYLGKCLRLAVLMHDTGHGAFSHQAEKSGVVKSILHDESTFKKLWKGQDLSKIYSSSQHPLYHEHYSVRSAFAILNDVNIEMAGIFVNDVLNIMETTDGVTSDKFNQSCDHVWSIFTSTTATSSGKEINKPFNILNVLKCILSGEFDADKGDYLLRDSMHTGANFGRFDLDSLINSLGASWIPDDDSLRITINKKGIGSLEDIVLSRHQMYSYVYNHKAVNGMELALHLAIDEVLSDNSAVEEVITFMTDIREFAYLTDNFFWEKFRIIARRDQGSACYCLINRIKTVHLGTFSDLDEFEILETKNEIAAKTGLDVDDIYASTHTVRFSKINDDFRDIMIEIIDPISKTKSYKKISEVSDFFEKFKNVKTTSFHRR